jgi:hypothetical protein
LAERTSVKKSSPIRIKTVVNKKISRPCSVYQSRDRQGAGWVRDRAPFIRAATVREREVRDRAPFIRAATVREREMRDRAPFIRAATVREREVRDRDGPSACQPTPPSRSGLR